MLDYWNSAYQMWKEQIYFFLPGDPLFHYSNIPARLKRTLEWSKILFSERRGIRATNQGSIEAKGQGVCPTEIMVERRRASFFGASRERSEFFP
jgi:hypothetical protein